MGKNKLKKFSEVAQMECVFQYPFGVLVERGFPMRGRWRYDYFRNANPVVLELGCGRGEYTVGLAQRFPGKNFIGIDIKGARIWAGARQVTDEGIANAAFLRTSIELLPRFFAAGEVDELWITFPDPQAKKATKRLTGTRFMDLYRQVVRPGGIVHLKTDSPFLYAYTRAMVLHNGFVLLADTADLYAAPPPAIDGAVMGIQTHYERQWLDRGLTIKYLAWRLDHGAPLDEPADEIAPDTYRSYSRGQLQMPGPVSP